MKILTVFRISPTTDEYVIYKNLLKIDNNLFNFDDRFYIYFAGPNLFCRLLKYLFRPFYINFYNKEIQRYLRFIKPNLFVIFFGGHISKETILIAKKYKTKIVFIYPDLNIHKKVIRKDFLKTIRDINYFYYMKPNKKNVFLKVNTKAKLISPIISKKFIKEIEKPDLTIGVLIVANFAKNKELIIKEFLTKYSKKVTLIGDGWQKLSSTLRFPNLNYLGPLYTYEITNFYRKALCNFGLLGQDKYSKEIDEITMRTFNVPAHGGLLLHKRNNISEKIYGKNSKILYSSIDEAVDISYSLNKNSKLRKKLFQDQQKRIIKNGTFIEDLVKEWI